MTQDQEDIGVGNLVPTISDSGSTPGVQSSHQQDFQDATSQLIRRPYAQEFDDIVREGVGGSGSRVSLRLTNAAFQQVEYELDQTRQRNRRLETTRDELVRRCQELEIRCAKLQIEVEGLRRYRWVEAFLYVMGSILVAVGLSASEHGALMMLVGGGMIVFGFCSPVIIGQKKKKRG